MHCAPNVRTHGCLEEVHTGDFDKFMHVFVRLKQSDNVTRECLLLNLFS